MMADRFEIYDVLKEHFPNADRSTITSAVEALAAIMAGAPAPLESAVLPPLTPRVTPAQLKPDPIPLEIEGPNMRSVRALESDSLCMEIMCLGQFSQHMIYNLFANRYSDKELAGAMRRILNKTPMMVHKIVGAKSPVWQINSEGFAVITEVLRRKKRNNWPIADFEQKFLDGKVQVSPGVSPRVIALGGGFPKVVVPEIAARPNRDTPVKVAVHLNDDPMAREIMVLHGFTASSVVHKLGDKYPEKALSNKIGTLNRRAWIEKVPGTPREYWRVSPEGHKQLVDALRDCIGRGTALTEAEQKFWNEHGAEASVA
jgi:hypothetical protein